MFQKNETYTILEECHLMSNIPKRNLASGYRNGSLSADVARIVHTVGLFFLPKGNLKQNKLNYFDLVRQVEALWFVRLGLPFSHPTIIFNFERLWT